MRTKMDKKWFQFINGFLLLIILMSVGIAGVSAQGIEPECDAPPLLIALGDAVAALQAGEGVDDALLALRGAMGTYQAACAGMVFEGEGEWISDPMTMPDGIYRATFTNNDDGLGSFVTTNIDGDCDFILMSSSDGEIDQAAIEFRECKTIFEISSRGTWQLAFELLSP